MEEDEIPDAIQVGFRVEVLGFRVPSALNSSSTLKPRSPKSPSPKRAGPPNPVNPAQKVSSLKGDVFWGDNFVSQI